MMKRSTAVVLGGVVIGMSMMANTAQAAPITYQFSATVATPRAGSDAVTGTFSYDATTQQLGATFNFSTPAGSFTPGAASLTIYDPADAPALPFLLFSFATSPDYGFLNLWFQSTADGFSGGALYTQAVSAGQGVGLSNLVYPGLSYFTGFASGTAIAAVPEPATLSLLALGIVGAGLRGRLRR